MAEVVFNKQAKRSLRDRRRDEPGLGSHPLVVEVLKETGGVGAAGSKPKLISQQMVAEARKDHDYGMRCLRILPG